MGRVLSDEPCKVTFNDQISGRLLGIRYRLPTNDERVSYFAEMAPKPGSEGEKKHNPAEIRTCYGALIITGFDEGSFDIPDGEGKCKAIASDQASPNYDAAWKEKIKQYAADVLGMLALFVFENALTRLPGAQDPFGPILKALLESDALREAVKSAVKSLEKEKS